jgi:hypothetical protein
MRVRSEIVAAAFICIQAAGAIAADVIAQPPIELAVTVYRAPARWGGSIDLDELNGFALVSETRLVSLPAGVSRLRFAGVADGIEAQSAIITGLPRGILEKNRDAGVLSPSSLLAATIDKPVELERTNRKTGKTERVAGTILSDAGGGVVFNTAEGVEALRCSGLPESFSFEADAVPPARPSLSVLVRTPTAMTGKVTVSYLSRGFDWAADYSATLSADERFMDLGAWVTLANSNGTTFPSANTQVVAGRVNRETGTVEPFDLGGPILANCWPRGSTSDIPESRLRFAVAANAMRSMVAAPSAMMGEAWQQVMVTGQRKVAEEQLGDLKLYRVPERTTVAGRQLKQVRLLDRSPIPITTVYRASLSADDIRTAFAAERVLRTLNTQANHLGVPLPSGRVEVFALHDGQRLLLHEANMRDLAVNEELEIELGGAADVQVAVVHEALQIDSTQAKQLPLLPGVTLHRVRREQMERVQISNARGASIQMELTVVLYDGAEVIRADHPLASKNGKPVFRLTIPAHGTLILRYQLQYLTSGNPR